MLFLRFPRLDAAVQETTTRFPSKLADTESAVGILPQLHTSFPHAWPSRGRVRRVTDRAICNHTNRPAPLLFDNRHPFAPTRRRLFGSVLSVAAIRVIVAVLHAITAVARSALGGVQHQSEERR
jgi:hypothetical protein